jgi:hypothetical protein
VRGDQVGKYVIEVAQAATNKHPMLANRGRLRLLGGDAVVRHHGFGCESRRRFSGNGDVTAMPRNNAPVLLLGDLNVLEPGHLPPHPGQFAPFVTAFYTALQTLIASPVTPTRPSSDVECTVLITSTA